jgi:hypothetical protein
MEWRDVATAFYKFVRYGNDRVRPETSKCNQQELLAASLKDALSKQVFISDACSGRLFTLKNISVKISCFLI